MLKFGTVVLILGISIPILGGCASERYLSEQEDAQMRKMCEDKANGGCAVIPGNTWKAIQQLFGGGTGI